MGDIIVVLVLLSIVWALFGMAKPEKAAPFLKKPSRLKIIGIFIVLFISIGTIGPIFNPASPASSSTKKNAEEEKTDKEAQKKNANSEVIKKLGTFIKRTDEVEKSEWYTSYGDTYPAQTAVYWYVGINSQDQINQRFKVVHFSNGINWVFWDNVIFSTSETKWKYEIDSFAGQSGGGKSTQIVMGGKYETLDLPISKVEKGLEIVTSGSNPIIRLAGKEQHYDIKLTSEDVANLKSALEFSKNSKIIDGKITRGQ